VELVYELLDLDAISNNPEVVQVGRLFWLSTQNTSKVSDTRKHHSLKVQGIFFFEQLEWLEYNLGTSNKVKALACM
jgi:hypothetical protein